MRFGFTADQLALRDGLRELLAAACPPEAVRETWSEGEAWRNVWTRLAELGLPGLLAPDEAGGLGCTEVEMVLLLEECGRFAAPGPLAEHVAVAVPALAGSDRLNAAAAGELVVTAAEADAGHLRWAAQADLAVLSDGDQLVLATVTPGEPRRGVDHALPAATMAGTERAELPGADPAAAADRGALAVAAQLVGLGAHLIDMTARYVRDRVQFGVPIGSQQAVKHHLADALIAVEHARPAVYRAGYALARHEPDAPVAVSFAKVYAARAADRAVRAALQCHGAIGYTWEHDLHLWAKRVWALAPCWGTVAAHQDRVAAALLGGD